MQFGGVLACLLFFNAVSLQISGSESHRGGFHFGKIRGKASTEKRSIVASSESPLNGTSTSTGQQFATIRGPHPQSPKVTICISSIPSKYSKYTPEEAWGFHALGKMIDIEQQHWEPHVHFIDKWWINQLNISPLRVMDEEAADLIFVPATLRTTDIDIMRDFFTKAYDFLPLLGKKPHVLVLDHPMDLVKQYHKEFFENEKELIRQFHIISPEGYSRDWDIDWNYVIGTPYFGSVHWHRGPEFAPRPFAPAAVLRAKKNFIMYSAKIRLYPVRYRFHDDCMEFGKGCTFVDWQATDQNEVDLAKQTFKAMVESWFILMPRGDSIMRNSFYDALMVWCVPVMSEGDYARYCPYNDIIDYSAFVEIAIPKESGNVVTHLNETFDEEKAMSRLQRLHQVQRVLQYSLNPLHELIRFDKLHTLEAEEDAFTYTWKAVLRKLCSQGWLPHRCPVPS